MDTTTYLTLEQVLVIHEDQIIRYGGSTGLRDLALLESAVFRPQTTFAGDDLYDTHYKKAAALLHGLVMNHAFVDGNKRTGTASMLVYLELNAVPFFIKNEELVKAILQVENEKWNVDKIAAWLEEHSSQI